jgi:hypothetical protein
LILLTSLLSACRGPDSAASAVLTVAPEFEPFWRRAGGMATLGPPVSPPRREGRRLHQTFLAVEMIQETSGGRNIVRLAPLGWDLGLAEPAVPPIDGQDASYFPGTGHTLYAGFASLFEELGGQEVVGAPITEVAFGEGQIVQYFENAGLYRPENASPADTRLVALGLSARPPADSFGLEPEAFVLPGLVRQRPFAEFLGGFGGEALFGQPLTGPYLTEDGALQQVYERAVVFSPDGSMRRAAFRSLGSELGRAQAPSPASKEQGATYFEETGHNVLWAFADFYRAIDGRALLGLPLEEAVLQADRFTQRFENGILEYRYDLPPSLAVQLAPLGRSYLDDHPPPTAQPDGIVVAPSAAAGSRAEELQIEASLSNAILPTGAEQAVTIRVSRHDGKPVAGAAVLMRLIRRGRDSQERLPETDIKGRTTGTWTNIDPATGEIVNVVVQATADDANGSALLQYAYGFTAWP